MKRLLLSLCSLFLAAGLFAQAPSGFKFQAVARDVDNNAMATENIAVRVSLLKGGPSGSVSYSERHEVTTTDLGVFDLHIGNGVGLSGDMTTIDWGGDNYYLKVDIDPDGGTSYINLGASQLLSVPYAMYATSAGSGGGGGNPTDELQNLIYDPTSQTLTLTDGNSVTLQVGDGGGMPQSLSFDNNSRMLTISEGNTIEIPGGATGPQGEPGPKGDQGDQGPAGMDGAPGPQGDQGPAGMDGQDGTGISLLGTVATVANLPTMGNTQGDLYIVTATGDGYAWDGSMWNNSGPIQGPKGDQGDQGPAGMDGAPGPQGDQGPAGMDGAPGPQGDQGPAGMDGAPGPQGDQGPAGMDGAPGPQGDQGPAGMDGEGIALKGSVSSTGALPLNGNEVGDLYLVGNAAEAYAWDGSMWNSLGSLRGPRGEQGDAGPTGMDGAPGPQGDQGPQGDRGPVGPEGPQGDQGPAGDLELPYYDEGSEDNGAAFHVQNDGTTGRYGIAGSVGVDAEDLPSNNAGVLGHGVAAHGVYGYSETSFWAGVQGVSSSATGVGVQGYGFGGGKGGHFYTTSSGVAALTTGTGNVGIGIDEPQHKMHVGGDLFVQTNLGELRMGFPDNGNQWQMSTRGSGADLQFQSKPDGSNTFTTQFRMRQNGEFQFGNLTTGTPEAWIHIAKNSTINKPQLKLEEVGNDYARLELTNDAASGAYWHVAGLPSSTTANARLNFYFRNANGAADRMTITGDGEVGINGTPTARLHVHQRSQTVGTGLRFSDNTANADWDVTHGFALRFHYGGSIRGFINATTGAYVQGSDKRLKANVNVLSPVLNKINQLAVKTYHYKSDESQESTIGLIAQEAKELFPELVSYSKADDMYGVNYAGFSMVAIKAIQEQQEVIEEQQTEIDALKARLARIEALLLPQADRE